MPWAHKMPLPAAADIMVWSVLWEGRKLPESDWRRFGTPYILSAGRRKSKFKTDLFIAALGAQAQKLAFGLTNELRHFGFAAEMDYTNKSLKSQLKRADKLNSSFALIFGDKEINEKQVLLRNMQTKDQQSIPMDGLLESIIKIIKER